MIPDIIGDTGFILDHRDPDLLEVLISEALGTRKKAELAVKARERVLEQFSLGQRKQQLFAVISGGAAS
jgi:hypothetical protein